MEGKLLQPKNALILFLTATTLFFAYRWHKVHDYLGNLKSQTVQQAVSDASPHVLYMDSMGGATTTTVLATDFVTNKPKGGVQVRVSYWDQSTGVWRAGQSGFTAIDGTFSIPLITDNVRTRVQAGTNATDVQTNIYQSPLPISKVYFVFTSPPTVVK